MFIKKAKSDNCFARHCAHNNMHYYKEILSWGTMIIVPSIWPHVSSRHLLPSNPPAIQPLYFGFPCFIFITALLWGLELAALSELRWQLSKSQPFSGPFLYTLITRLQLPGILSPVCGILLIKEKKRTTGVLPMAESLLEFILFLLRWKVLVAVVG